MVLPSVASGANMRASAATGEFPSGGALLLRCLAVVGGEASEAVRRFRKRLTALLQRPQLLVVLIWRVWSAIVIGPLARWEAPQRISGMFGGQATSIRAEARWEAPHGLWHLAF